MQDVTTYSLRFRILILDYVETQRLNFAKLVLSLSTCVGVEPMCLFKRLGKQLCHSLKHVEDKEEVQVFEKMHKNYERKRNRKMVNPRKTGPSPTPLGSCNQKL